MKWFLCAFYFPFAFPIFPMLRMLKIYLHLICKNAIPHWTMPFEKSSPFIGGKAFAHYVKDSATRISTPSSRRDALPFASNSVGHPTRWSSNSTNCSTLFNYWFFFLFLFLCLRFCFDCVMYTFYVLLWPHGEIYDIQWMTEPTKWDMRLKTGKNVKFCFLTLKKKKLETRRF